MGWSGAAGSSACSARSLGARRLVPLADRALLDEAERPEDDDAEERRHDHRRQQLLAVELDGVALEQLADARLALAEEEVADHGADHRQPGRDPEAGED